MIPLGRTLDSAGNPIEGTGVILDASSKAYQLLMTQDAGWIFTNPITNEVVAEIALPNEKGEIVKKGLGIMAPGASGPPEHVHPSYVEYFEVVDGEAIFTINGEDKVLKAGERITIPINTPHTFRPAKNETVTFLVEAVPAGNLKEVVQTIFALAHEKKLNGRGEPRFWQAMAIGADLQNDTMFTHVPFGFQKFMFSIFGPIAKWMGYKSLYPQYLQESYWKTKVEQM